MMQRKGYRTLLPATVTVLALAGCGGNGDALDVAPQPPAPVATPLDAGLAMKAEAIVRRDAAADDPAVRANAAEAAEQLPDAAAADVLVPLLDDDDPVVRFAATMAIGRRQLDPPGVRERLAELVRGESPNGRVAATFALHRLGDTSYSQSLARASVVDDAVVRSHAALAMGLTGEPSAATVLKRMLRDGDANVRITAAEALWRLGDKAGLQPLMGTSVSKYSDDRTIGTLALGHTRDEGAMNLLEGHLTDDYAEVALAAARALGRVGSDRGYAVALDYVDDDLPLRRGMAAAALGDIGRSDAQDELAALLADDDRGVRLAAASAVLALNQGPR